MACKRNHGVVEKKDIKVSNTPSTIAEISKKITRQMNKGNINTVVR